jgi:hypothetical protein
LSERGPRMPVLCFQKRADIESSFEILLNHFDATWDTSDLDLFHLSIRLASRDRFVRAMLHRRRESLRVVLSSVKHRSADGSRKSRTVRQPCLSSPAAVVNLLAPDGTSSHANVVDYSCNGLGLNCASTVTFQRGDHVTLTVAPITKDSFSDSLAAHYNNRDYVVK